MTRPSEEMVRALVSRALAEAMAVPTGDAAPVPMPSPATPESTSGVSRRLAIGADHGGFGLKGKLITQLTKAGWEIVDCGTNSTEACDYPDFAHAVAVEVASGRCRLGIVIDGAGIGSAMVANKVPGVRAALAYDLSSARNGREHNHANVLTLGAGLIGEALAAQIVEAWLATPWGGDRHARRVEKVMAVERRYLQAPAVASSSTGRAG